MEMKINIKYSFQAMIVFTLMVGIYGCQESYLPDTSEEDQLIVVEGFIESGEGSNPTFVLLTKSLPFIGEIDAQRIEELFVRGAKVVVSTEEEEYSLTEICLDQLPPEIVREAALFLDLDPDSLLFNLCAYVDVFNQIPRREGGRYNLTVHTENAVLTASTTIPRYIPLYGFRWDDPPGNPNDSLATLYARVDDFPDEANFYRYRTGKIGEPLESPFASVANDVFFDGQSFEFILNKAEPRGSDIDPELFGLYPRGDSILIKWSNIDQDHFNFWNSLEFSANSAGPFSSYTRVSSNISGGLGIWGGYASGYYRLKVPEK
jgi:hypothetical protein